MYKAVKSIAFGGLAIAMHVQARDDSWSSWNFFRAAYHSTWFVKWICVGLYIQIVWWLLILVLHTPCYCFCSSEERRVNEAVVEVNQAVIVQQEQNA